MKFTNLKNLVLILSIFLERINLLKNNYRSVSEILQNNKLNNYQLRYALGLLNLRKCVVPEIVEEPRSEVFEELLDDDEVTNEGNIVANELLLPRGKCIEDRYSDTDLKNKIYLLNVHSDLLIFIFKLILIYYSAFNSGNCVSPFRYRNHLTLNCGTEAAATTALFMFSNHYFYYLILLSNTLFFTYFFSIFVGVIYF